MNPTFRNKPHFLEVINRQAIANHRLQGERLSETQRRDAERHLQPVPLVDLEVTRLPLVRLKEVEGRYDGGRRWVVLGEIAQSPGKVILLDVGTGAIDLTFSSEELELVPPAELA